MSLCKSGSLEAFKTALIRGDMEEMNCDQKLHCATTALKSRRDNREILVLMHILLEYLGIDRFDEHFVSKIADDRDKQFLTFHHSCMKKAVASPGSEFSKLIQSSPNGIDHSKIGLRQRRALDMEIHVQYEKCRENTAKFVQMNKVLQEARKEEEEIREKKKRGGCKEAICEEISIEEIKGEDTAGQRRGRNARRRRRRKEKARGASEDVLGEKVRVEDVLDEKVKVKADLRSKLSRLELEEEAEKKKLSSAVEEQDASSLALEGRMEVVSEEKYQLCAELGDIEATMESLMKRKREIMKKKDMLEKESVELERRREEWKESSNANIRHLTAKLEKVQTEVKKVRKELDLAEGRTEDEHLHLEKFMARQIQELREELECPVCLEVTSKAPIYKCPDDHLICR